MLWSQISLKPCSFQARHGQLEGCQLTLALPLVADGRIAWGLLRHASAKATVECRSSQGSSTRGKMRVVDHVCQIDWPQDAPEAMPRIRVTAPRFRLGDVICLRPDDGPISLFRVCEAEPLELAD